MTGVDGGAPLRWFLGLTQFLMILDTAILNVAVPVIGTELAMSPAAETWVLNAYVVAFGGLLLVGGSIADTLGHGRVLVVGLVVLALGAGIGALAHSGAVLIASRALQGAGAAMAAASAMALVFSRYSGGARRKTLGLFASMAGFGGAVGTALSGLLTEYWGWRATFWVNAVAAAVLVVWACRLQGFFMSGRQRQLSVLGGLLVTVALASTAYAITSTSDGGAGAHTAAAGLLAATTAAMFIVRERRSSNPLIGRAIWRIPPLLRALLLAGVGQWVLVPVFLFISLYLQRVLGYEPLIAGLALLPMSVIIFLVAPLAPPVIARWGVTPVMAAAFLLVAGAGAWLTQVSVDGSFAADVLGPTLLLAFGLPLVSISTNLMTAENAPAQDPGTTSGLLTTTQQFGATLGLASWVAIAATGPTSNLQDLAEGHARAFLVAAVAMALAALGAMYRPRHTARPLPGP
ncbi:MFS transporter [Micromonospora andamanensis]|uniref:MFS transporter n=1 Tax=Micromonospora andamanensis TaxID=1287068 RepID=A0ABQ4I3M8_9ACTN|nr:MFS transporter [Micromonospora andamanensis]GIJ12494.1 MFS transporter [Micromonospora andamanensis]